MFKNEKDGEKMVKVITSVYITVGTRVRLDDFARKYRRSKSWIVDQALKEFFEKYNLSVDDLSVESTEIVEEETGQRESSALPLLPSFGRR